MLTLVADKVIVGELSQFGPIDPQLPRVINPGISVWISARVVKDTIEKTLKEEIKKFPAPAQAAIAASVDWIFYQQSLDAIDLVKELVNTYANKYNDNLKVEKNPPRDGRQLPEPCTRHLARKTCRLRPKYY